MIRIKELRNISIHAPAKGATIMALIGFGVIKISIHAPAKGATPPPKRWQTP